MLPTWRRAEFRCVSDDTDRDEFIRPPAPPWIDTPDRTDNAGDRSRGIDRADADECSMLRPPVLPATLPCRLATLAARLFLEPLMSRTASSLSVGQYTSGPASSCTWYGAILPVPDHAASLYHRATTVPGSQTPFFRRTVTRSPISNRRFPHRWLRVASSQARVEDCICGGSEPESRASGLSPMILPSLFTYISQDRFCTHGFCVDEPWRVE
jgi:hypothetical protein